MTAGLKYEVLLHGYSWPDGKTFGNGEGSDHPVWSLEVDPGAFSFEECEGLNGMPPALWGLGEALDSRNPSDPDAHILDHDAYREPLPGGVSASGFLQGLVPEDG